MKHSWLALVTLVTCLTVQSAGPDGEYVRVYTLIQQAEQLRARGDDAAADQRFGEAQSALKRLQTAYPGWNERLVQFRLDYVAEQLGQSEPIPEVAPLPVRPDLPPPGSPTPSQAASSLPETRAATGGADDVQKRLEAMQAQAQALDQALQQLSGEKRILEEKLREALAIRPAAIDPEELRKAEERIETLEKEKDLLLLSLEQEKEESKNSERNSEVAALREQLKQLESSRSEAEAKLEQALAQNAELQQRLGALQEAESQAKELQSANEVLRERLSGIEDVEGLKARVASLGMQLEEERLRTKAAEKQANQLEAAIRLANDRASALEDEIKAASERTQPAGQTDEGGEVAMSAFRSALKALQKENAVLLEANSQLRSKVSELESRAIAGADGTDSGASSIESRQRVSQLEEELSNARALAATNAFMMGALRSAVAALNEEKEVLEKRNAAFERKLSEPISAVETVNALKQAEQELETLRGVAENQQQAMHQLEKEKDLLQERLKQIESGAGESALRQQEFEQAAEERRRELEAVRQENTRLEQELARLREKAEEAGVDLEAKVRSLSGQVDELNAVVSALESKSQPYSQHELALLQEPKVPAAVQEPAREAQSAPAKKGLPSGSEEFLAQAERAFAAGRYADAEEAYLRALESDNKNVHTLSNLAATHLAQDRLGDAEERLAQALSIQPDDAYSVSLMGIVRFRQGKYDDALRHLSRAAELNPANPETHNYLGITLSQKGQRAAAEAALRKALEISPGYAGAHHNLAVIYASQDPPFTELARWHYEKALANGHSRHPELERLLEKAK